MTANAEAVIETWITSTLPRCWKRVVRCVTTTLTEPHRLLRTYAASCEPEQRRRLFSGLSALIEPIRVKLV